MLFSKLRYQVTFLCMKCCPVKRRALFQKDMLEKHCAVVKSYQDTWEKPLYIEKIIMSRNTKYYIKSFKRNKVKLSDIRGL